MNLTGAHPRRNIALCSLLLTIVILVFWAHEAQAYSLKGHKKFAKHLYRFMKKEKGFFKKKAFEGAALLALGSMTKKKVFPIPLPLPIPIVHQPIIHEPMFIPPPPIGKFAAKGLAKGAGLDMLTVAKTGGLAHGGLGLGGLGGLGALGGLGGLGGFGGLGGLGMY